MTVIGWIEIVLYGAVVVALVRPLGWYMTPMLSGSARDVLQDSAAI